MNDYAELLRGTETPQQIHLRPTMGGENERAISALGQGADPNVCNKGGNTALMLAARWAQVDMLKALLDAGADVNLTNSDGDTTLSWPQSGEAVTRGHRVTEGQCFRDKAQASNPESHIPLLDPIPHF